MHRLSSWLQGYRAYLLIVFLGAVLYVPFLGLSGLWDPWEPHYAEVAREMVESGNWLDPTWEHSVDQDTEQKYFFSKPVLTFWLMAVPMKLFGIHAENGGIVSGAEWYLRLPFVLLAICGLIVTYLLAEHFFGSRVGLLATLIVATCPQYLFIARQATADMPFTALLTGGMAFVLRGGFDVEPRPGWLYAGYGLLGLAVLAKGLIGFFLPGLIFLVYFLISGDWGRLWRLRPFTGGLLAVLVAFPWLIYMSIASVVQGLYDDEGKTFSQRFFLHDHLYRVAYGVHGDRGTFAYFIEQLGIGTAPWFPFMLWGAASSTRHVRADEPDRTTRVELVLFIWVVAGFGLYSLSVTKFHHYILPIIPALAILAARVLYRFGQSVTERINVPLMLCLVLLTVLIARDIGLMPKTLTDLFVYNYTREFPEAAAIPSQIGYGAILGFLGLTLVTLFLFYRDLLRRWLVTILAGFAIGIAIWSGWFFFTAMGQHWSQRHLFDTYFATRAPDDPIGAYLMNWRGETFYSRNQVTQIKTNSQLKAWESQFHDRRRFLLVEPSRLEKLKEQLNPEDKDTMKILDNTCNKYLLISIEKDVVTRPENSLK